MQVLSLLSDIELVPKDPAPLPQRNLARPILCPLCHSRQDESHYCHGLGRSEVILGVGYADSEMRLVQT
jgi:hypothetical protein